MIKFSKIRRVGQSKNQLVPTGQKYSKDFRISYPSNFLEEEELKIDIIDLLNELAGKY